MSTKKLIAWTLAAGLMLWLPGCDHGGQQSTTNAPDKAGGVAQSSPQTTKWGQYRTNVGDHAVRRACVKRMRPCRFNAPASCHIKG